MFRLFENLVDPYAPYAEDDVPPNRLWPFLKSYLVPFRKVIALNAITASATAAAEVGLIYYLGRLVDLLSTKTPAEFWAVHKTELVLVLIFILLIRPLIETLDTALIKNAIQPNVAGLGRWRAYRHVLRQPVGWFEADFAGRIANRTVFMPGAVGDIMFQIMNALTFTVAYLVGASFLLANSDPVLLIPLGLWLLLYLGLLYWSMKRVRPASRASSAARSRTLGFVVDSFSNIQSVKLFSHNERETEYAVDILEHHRKTYMAENRIITVMDAGLATLNGILIVSVVGWALMMWTNGTASMGIVAAAGALALRINAMTGWILGAVSSFLRALGVVSEGMDTVAQPIGLTDSDDAIALPAVKGHIELRGLVHHYGRGQGGINDVSFKISPGEKVGLVGRSGAGKSTLVKSVLRLYDPEGGQVFIDGHDVSKVTQHSLRGQIGMVQQETSLLHRSIRENIIFGRPDASDADIQAAAKKAQAHAFIQDLQDANGLQGYGAQVGERGVKLSGGQRQRIALARVILKDAPILILDEATSALDSEVEAEIQETLYGMMEGKTVIAIAHRLSTIAQMDRILVIDEGRIVETGTHAELLEDRGLYAGFWARQSGGFVGVD